jgi:hypothetical protein
LTSSDNVLERVQIRMTAGERALFERSISKVRYYLEFGCGGSTEIAVAKGVPSIVSVESDADWIEKLKEKEHIAQAVANNRLRFEYVDVGPVGAWGVPKDESKIRNWPKYFLTPFEKYDRTFDYILIDGRFRTSCAFAAYAFAAEHTVVAVHDYINRHGFFEIEKFYDIIEAEETLYLFKKKPHVNLRSLYVSTLKSIFSY